MLVLLLNDNILYGVELLLFGACRVLRRRGLVQFLEDLGFATKTVGCGTVAEK